MSTIIGKLSEIPQDKSENTENNKFEIKKKETKEKTQKEITIEEFKNLSWKDFKKNIRVAPNGKLTLFGKSISYWMLNAQSWWTHEKIINYKEYKKEILKQQQKIFETLRYRNEKIHLITDIIDIWKQQAIKTASSIWFKGFRKDDDIIFSNIKKIDKNYSDLKNLVFIGVLNEKGNNEKFNDKLFNILQLMKNSEKQKNIIGEDDLNKIMDLFFDENLDFKQKQIKIFNLMRYGGLSGNSEGVKEVIANKLLKTKEFQKEKEILNNPKIREYLESDKKEELEKILGKELTENLTEIYKKTKENTEKYLRHSLGEENEKRAKNKKKLLNLEEYKKLKNFDNIVLASTLEGFKHILIYKHIENLEYRGSENNSLTGIYANITGLAEHKGIGDYFVIGDDKIDIAIDFASTLAIGAITMGAGIGATILARSVITGTRLASLGNKALKIARIEKYFEVGTKTRLISSFIGNATLDGVMFHEGATLMQNIMFRDIFDENGDLNTEELLKGTKDTNEIIKSIAFMGALNSLQFISKVPGLRKLNNLKFGDKIPKEYLDKHIFQKILINTGNFAIKGLGEGTTMFIISGMIEELLGEGWHPTIEEYLHFIVLIQLIHLKDKKF